MKIKVTTIVFAVLWLAAEVAQGHTIGLYADAGGTTCNISETLPLTYVYVVHHIPASGAIGCSFSAPKPACWTGATWLQDIEPYSWPGNSQFGKSIGYGSCLTGTLHILTIVYFAQGLSEPCCLYPVLPDPNVPSGEIEIGDCDYNTVFGVGLVTTINGDPTCPCGYPVAVEETTWGGVKALYGE